MNTVLFTRKKVIGIQYNLTRLWSEVRPCVGTVSNDMTRYTTIYAY